MAESPSETTSGTITMSWSMRSVQRTKTRRQRQPTQSLITFRQILTQTNAWVRTKTWALTPNKGYCIGFSGSLTSESSRLKGVGIRSGSVSANGSGNLDNAIGFAGCEDFYAEDIYSLMLIERQLQHRLT